MASKVTSNVLKISSRRYGAQAATKAAAVEGVQVSKLASGTVVASLENNSPLSRVAVYLKGGSRYNTFPGASHTLAICATAGLSSLPRTGLNMVRSREQIGAELSVTADREAAVYGMVGSRDNISESLSVLASLTSNNTYRYYEFPSERHTLRVKAMLEISPADHVLDLAAKAAFRSQGLGNSVYLPNYFINKVTVDQVNSFVESTHGSQGLVVVGTGVDHEVLSAGAEALGLSGGGSASSSANKYLGGDVRLETGGNLAHVVIAGEGAKFDESAATAVAAELLASGPRIKYAGNSSSVLLNAAKDVPVLRLQGLNLPYSDTGLLGFTFSASAGDAPKLTSAMVAAAKNLSASEKDVAGAKARVKKALLDLMKGCSEVDFIGRQLLYTGGFMDLPVAIKAVDSVTPAAVSKALSKAFGGKLTVSAVGNVNNIPYSDTL